MTRLNRVGTVAYNGFKFPAPFQSTVSGIPIFDSSGRTVKYYQWTFRIEGVLVSEDLTFTGDPEIGVKIDDEMDTLRVILTTPAREFVFFDQGFGDLVVNKGFAKTSFAPASSTSVALDAAFGPKPTFSAWQPRGSNHAVFISWECVIMIPQSCLIPQFKNALSEFNYDMSWSIDERNRTVRTTNVTIEIPMTRFSANSRKTPTTIDKFRSLIKVPTIKGEGSGFHRSSNFTMSEDKRIMKATIVDTEILSQNPYFPGMIKMDVTHSVSSKGNVLVPRGDQMWTNVISGRVEVAPNAPKALGWTAIQHVVNQRMRIPLAIVKEDLAEVKAKVKLKGLEKLANIAGEILENVGLLDAPTPVFETKLTRGLKIITSLSVQEEIFGMGISFSVEYIVAAPLSTFLVDTGLFTPIPGSWTEWRQSLDTIDPNRGFAKMQRFSSDLIVDLCIKDEEEIREFIFPSPAIRAFPFAGVPKKIKKRDTYLEFQNMVFKLVQTNRNEFFPVFSTKSESQKKREAAFGQVPVTSSLGEGEAVVQNRGQPQIKLRMKGKATRAFLIPSIPRIISVAGLSVVNVGNPTIITGQIAIRNGIPIFGAQWSIDYRIASVKDLKPGDIKIVGGDPEFKTLFTLS